MKEHFWCFVLKVEYVEDKYKLNQAEITRLNKENEELRYLNEQLTSNLEKMQEEVNDMQLNEEKFMQQVFILLFLRKFFILIFFFYYT